MNVQNIPRTEKSVKRCFIPKLDAFLFFDYKAIEVRLLAYYMATQGDTSLAEELKAGSDPHLETAKGIFTGEITDEMRQAGKTLNFSMIYGGGVPTLMRQLGVSRQEAARMLHAFHAHRPGVKQLSNAIWEVYQDRGHIRTLWNRQLHPDSKHKALNYLIQGCAADLMRSALVKVHADLWVPWGQSHIVNTVHDEIIVDAASDEIPKLVERIPGLMKNETIEKLVPIEVDVEISRTNWAEKESYVVCTSG